MALHTYVFLKCASTMSLDASRVTEGRLLDVTSALRNDENASGARRDGKGRAGVTYPVKFLPGPGSSKAGFRRPPSLCLGEDANQARARRLGNTNPLIATVKTCIVT
jgi:hypothetical protein